MLKKNGLVVIYGIGIFVLIGLLPSGPLHADMGAIYLRREGVSVSEPAQKAIILHNGSEEILILETDLKASARTEIMRFIPFPAKPRVSLAPENAFEEIGKLAKAKKLEYITLEMYKGGSATRKRPVAEIVSRARIGAHDVSIIKINDASHFSEWVRLRFKNRQQLLRGPELEQVSKTASDYVKDGICWFVFDFVAVDDSDKSVAPVAFRFKTKKIYYPLRTSNTIGGRGQVQLFFLAVDCVGRPLNSDLPWDMMGFKPEIPKLLFSTVAEISLDEAGQVYPGAADFFGKKRILLQAASRSGPLNFKKDLNSLMLKRYDPWLK